MKPGYMAHVISSCMGTSYTNGDRQLLARNVPSVHGISSWALLQKVSFELPSISPQIVEISGPVGSLSTIQRTRTERRAALGLRPALFGRSVVSEELTPQGQEIKRLAEERGMTLEETIEVMIALGANEYETRADIYWSEFMKCRQASEN